MGMSNRGFLRARIRAAGEPMLPAVRPLLVPDEHGDPVPAGSCVLLWYRGVQFAVSADRPVQEEVDSRHKAGVYRTYVGRLKSGESGVTVEALAAILAALGVSLGEFFKPFRDVVRPRTPRRRG